MVTIRAFAQVSVWQNFDDKRKPEPVTDTNRLMYFNGLEYRDEAFSDYFADGEDTSQLVELGVTGGYIRLEFSTDLNDLIAVTEYTAPAPLSTADLESLANYTAGQWTDGIGSNFSQCMSVATRTGIDLWPRDGNFMSQTDS
jgi:hypothetical protein